MSDKKLELNRRRVLAGLGTIGVASAGAGAGTMALFSDSETSSGNAVQAGTLNLTTSNRANIGVDVSQEKPGYFKRGTATLTNAGNLDGSLDIYLDNVSRTAEGSTGDTDPEEGSSSIRFESNYALEYGDLGHFPREISTTKVSDSEAVAMEVLNDGGSPSLKLEISSSPISFVVDSDNDGVIDYHLTYDPSTNTWGKKNTQADDTFSDQLDERYSNVTYDDDDGTDGTVKVTFDNESFPIAIGGGSYPSAGTLPFVPGFNWSYDSSGAAIATADRCVTVDPTDNESRHLEDILQVAIFYDDDQDGSFATVGDPGKVLVGKLAQVAGDRDLNQDFDSDAVSDVVIAYRIPINAGNSIQGDGVDFDVVFELNQEDSQ